MNKLTELINNKLNPFANWILIHLREKKEDLILFQPFLSSQRRSLFLIPVKIILILLFLTSGTFSLAKPQLSKSFRPQWLETLFQYENYYSTSNYNTSGQAVNLPSSGSFWASSEFDFSSRYVFSHRLAATGGLNFVNTQANQATITRYNGGLQTLRGGIEYKVPASFADFVIEGVVQSSLYKPDEASQKPLYGDGAHAMGGNFWMLQKFDAFYWHWKAGLLFRSDGLSGLFPYQVGFHWRTGSWTLSSLLDGAWSLTADTIGDTKRNNFLRRSNAGSMIYRSANPNSNKAYLQFKYDVTNQFGFNGGIGSTLFGRNSSNGASIFVGIDIHWQPIAITTGKAPFKNAVPSKSTNTGSDDDDDSNDSDDTPFAL